MSISSRRWIRWLPDAPAEPTTTIVLTSPKGLFVDVRTLIGNDNVGATNLDKTEADALHERGPDEPAVTSDRLDWAFAGRAEDLGLVDGGGKRRAWSHWVSSRGKDVTGVRDEGTMFPYDGGSENEELELEKGRMVNPATGQEQDYEELWAEEANEATGNPSSKLCIVMIGKHVDNGTTAGVVIRLGRYCQGVLRVEDKFIVERWLWDEKIEVWRRVVRIGDGEVPCSLVCNQGAKFKLGDDVYFHGRDIQWKVQEL